MKNNIKIMEVLFAALLSVLIIACGGGGGGGDNGGGGGSGGGISYSGSTSQAAIDNSNAGEISTSAYQNGSTGSALSLGSLQSDDRQIGSSRSLRLTQTLEKALLKVDVISSSDDAVSGASATDAGTIQGDCASPGNASYTITYDDVTGNFSGSMNFSSYCSEGVTISGSANFSGKVDVNTEDFLQLSISFDTLSAASGSDSFTADGDIAFDFDASPMTATINVLLKDNSTADVFKIENFSMTMSDGSNYVDVSVVSGRFYHPDYGYVDAYTSTALRIYSGDDWPSQGVLVCAGNTGTKSRLTALSSTQYTVEADTNGDGTFDYNSGPLNWADL
ncbi:MAG: hypothetical protein HZB61_15855 [Nitrospirae bacterium]|nr:hypothetical protein [Nitrospirota bacterium]